MTIAVQSLVSIPPPPADLGEEAHHSNIHISSDPTSGDVPIRLDDSMSLHLQPWRIRPNILEETFSSSYLKLFSQTRKKDPARKSTLNPSPYLQKSTHPADHPSSISLQNILEQDAAHDTEILRFFHPRQVAFTILSLAQGLEALYQEGLTPKSFEEDAIHFHETQDLAIPTYTLSAPPLSRWREEGKRRYQEHVQMLQKLLHAQGAKKLFAEMPDQPPFPAPFSALQGFWMEPQARAISEPQSFFDPDALIFEWTENGYHRLIHILEYMEELEESCAENINFHPHLLSRLIEKLTSYLKSNEAFQKDLQQFEKMEKIRFPHSPQVEDHLGKGAYGSVSKVWDARRQRFIALKRIERSPHNIGLDLNLDDIYFSHIRARDLCHDELLSAEHFVQLYEVYQTPSHIVALLQLIECENPDQVGNDIGTIERMTRYCRTLPSFANAKAIGELALQLVQGVQHLYELGYVFPDSRFGNILFTAWDPHRILMSDYDCLFPWRNPLRENHPIIAYPKHLAPELLPPHNALFREAQAVFSLGASLQTLIGFQHSTHAVHEDLQPFLHLAQQATHRNADQRPNLHEMQRRLLEHTSSTKL
jgi:hypothetical protein